MLNAARLPVRFPTWAWLALIVSAMAVIWAFAFGARYPLANYGNLPMQSLATLNHNSLESALLYVGAFVLLFILYVLAIGLVRAGSRGTGWVIVGGAIVMNGVMLPMHPMDAADIYDYIIRGRMTAFYGLNPMRDTPTQLNQDDTYSFVGYKDATSAYGPAWEVLAAITARFAGNDPSSQDNRNRAVLAFKLLACLGYALTLVGLRWVLLKVAPERVLVGMLIFAWNPLMIYFAGGTGHNDVWLAAALVFSIGCMVRRSYVAAIVLAVLGILIKFIPVLLLPILVIVIWRNLPWRERLRTYWIGGVLSAALIGVMYAPFWVGIGTLAIDRRAHMFTSSLGVLVRQSLEPLLGNDARAMVSIFALGSFGLFTVWQLWRLARTPQSDTQEVIRTLLRIILFYLLIAATWFQHWYLAWVIPLAVLLEPAPLVRLTLVFSYLVTWQPLLYNYVTLRYTGWLDPPWRDLIPVSVFMGGTYAYALAEWVIDRRTHTLHDHPVGPQSVIQNG